MKDATATVGTSLEVLAPYFPYKVQVQVLPDGWDPCTVVALDNLECRVVTRWFDELYNPESFTGRTSYEQVSYMDCLPVLRNFSALCDPLTDGTIPALEVAKIMWGHKGASARWAHERMEARVYDEHGRLLVYLSESFYERSLSIAAFEYLRRTLFAVGLEPHQYIAKSPAPATPTKQEGEPG